MALYIDADNVSYKYIDTIFENIKDNLNIKKIYGDFTQSELKNWINIINDYGIEPIQCFRIGRKQSTDMKLITDVMMDCSLYNNHTNIYKDIYLATSDVDFIPLCISLKKLGYNITLFCSQKSTLTHYVDNIISLKCSNKVLNVIEHFLYEMEMIISLNNFRKKVNNELDTQFKKTNIKDMIEENFDDFIVVKNKKTHYIIDIRDLYDDINNKEIDIEKKYKKIFDIIDIENIINYF